MRKHTNYAADPVLMMDAFGLVNPVVAWMARRGYIEQPTGRRTGGGSRSTLRRTMSIGLLSPADLHARASIAAWCSAREREEAEARARAGEATVGG